MRVKHRYLRVLVVVTAWLVVMSGGTAHAGPFDPSIRRAPPPPDTTEVEVTRDVTDPGKGGGSGGGRTCVDQTAGETVACQNDYGWWSNHDQNYCRTVQPQPSQDHWVWGGRTTGVIIECAPQEIFCSGDREVCWRWAPGPPEAISPQELAERAVLRMHLSTGPIHTAPPEIERIPTSKVPFGSPIWLAIEPRPDTTGPITTSATDGGLTVTATAQLIRTDWELRTASPGTQARLISETTCEGPNAPGTIYQRGMVPSDTTDMEAIRSPTCDFAGTTYKNTGYYTTTARSTWEITWTTNTSQTDTYQFTSQPTYATINIVEYQALNTNPTPQNIYPPLQEQNPHDK